jgi:hypothetical protein
MNQWVLMIEKYIKRVSRQTAVYWGSPTPREDGSNRYGTPVQIKCVWKDSTQLIPDRDMKEVSVKATVYVSQDLDEQGMLFLGCLADLTTSQKADPRLVNRAYEITRFIKTPSLYMRGEYSRVAIISPESSRIPPGIER